MNIALIGYGKMGKEIEKLAVKRGHKVVFIEDALVNPEEFTVENLQKADVAIEFTRPDSAYNNYLKCFEAGVPVVSGTTGWLEKMPEIQKICSQGKHTMFYASNFSLGVNIFFKLNELLAKMMNSFGREYNVEMQEIHHIHKLDKPSGTAVTLLEGVINNFEPKTAWTLEKNCADNEIYIDAVREGEVPGTHQVCYKSEIDDIEIKHTAHTRQGFVIGAVVAAEFLYGKPAGFYSMNDLMRFDF